LAYGIYFAVAYLIVNTYLTIVLSYAHFKTWTTEPGFPEKVSTATELVKRGLKKDEN
jgi:hypothetical protein